MNRGRVKTKVLANAMIIVTLFSTLLILRVSATSEWSKPRPSKYRVFDETIGNANTDGIASVTMGVTIGEYVKNSPSHDYNDYLGLKISVSANTRKGIEYETSGESFYWYSVSNPTGIDADNGGVWLDLYVTAPLRLVQFSSTASNTIKSGFAAMVS